jgi:hypothetical protein
MKYKSAMMTAAESIANMMPTLTQVKGDVIEGVNIDTADRFFSAWQQ